MQILSSNVIINVFFLYFPIKWYIFILETLETQQEGEHINLQITLIISLSRVTNVNSSQYVLFLDF